MSFEGWLNKRTQNVRNRVLRLNPSISEGDEIRGYHPSGRHLLHSVFMRGGGISRGEFIRRHGREAWRKIPPGFKLKFGRRQFILSDVYSDKIWRFFIGERPWIQEYARWPDEARFANDSACRSEMIPMFQFLNRLAKR